jgi:predicted DNA-binding transcriptional regulator AlpA
MATTNTGVRRRRAEWQALLERAERSRLSTVAFCAAEGISTASFYLWRKRRRAPAPVALDSEASAAAFLDLGVLSAPRADGPSWDLELDLGGGVVLRLRRG